MIVPRTPQTVGVESLNILQSTINVLERKFIQKEKEQSYSAMNSTISVNLPEKCYTWKWVEKNFTHLIKIDIFNAQKCAGIDRKDWWKFADVRSLIQVKESENELPQLQALLNQMLEKVEKYQFTAGVERKRSARRLSI